ncbi:hypothetical protein D7V86_04060 [bacterium D16-51]|nr:hypothetical protein D7V96_19100 [bacterium D16-59]RKI61708.1 hypothetical protein D7V86_04060 [bacterium D16-51]
MGRIIDFLYIVCYDSRVCNEPSASLLALGDCARVNNPIACSGVVDLQVKEGKRKLIREGYWISE